MLFLVVISFFFVSFTVEYIPLEMKIFTRGSKVSYKSYRVQSYDSILPGYFCITLTKFMLKIEY